jgi:hypothetical protein
LKNIGLALIVISLFALVVTGCASYYPLGGVYTGCKAGIAVGDSTSYSKVGTAESVSVLGLVAVGDASIQTAAKNGNITKIKYVDYEVSNVLGIYGTYKTIVYGD